MRKIHLFNILIIVLLIFNIIILSVFFIYQKNKKTTFKDLEYPVIIEALKCDTTIICDGEGTNLHDCRMIVTFKDINKVRYTKSINYRNSTTLDEENAYIISICENKKVNDTIK